MNNFEKFRDLHYGDSPLLIGNCWDLTSARIFAALGFKAIATSSRALALNLGYEDGQNLPFEMLLDVVKKIKSEVDVPFSVDLERGYADSSKGIADNLQKLFDQGVAGVNIEDSSPGDSRILRSVSDFQNLLSGIKEELFKRKIEIFINARTDGFLRKMPDAFSQTLERVVAYEKAGADGIFVPLAINLSQIKQISSSVQIPLNVLRTAGLPPFSQLYHAGVRRISMGSSAFEVAKKSLTNILESVLKAGSFEAFG
ncbi:MAG: isocitrate lyase/phosphoenolpyruvate mutase family protein [Bacteroidetes bacterium]|nr:MAG: isocitrate lyase/phosphoenolpyruvate mutase family protein [Bacteroidota bacterium]